MHGVNILSVGEIKAGLLNAGLASSAGKQSDALALGHLFCQKGLGAHAWCPVGCIAEGSLGNGDLGSERRVVEGLDGSGNRRLGGRHG